MGKINNRIALAIAAIVMACILISTGSNTLIDFENAANLGANTVDYFATDNGKVIHCHINKNLNECLNKAENKKTIPWIGNSQLHAINQWEIGETNSTDQLNKLIDHKKFNLVTLSQPNLNLQEALITIELALDKIKLETVILAVCFDDFREDEIGANLSKETNNSTKLRTQLAQSNAGENILKKIKPEEEVSNPSSNGKNSIQDDIELKLNQWLEQNSSTWKSRSNIRGKIFEFLYKLRNTIFFIKPTTTRKILSTPYNNNFNALIEIIKILKVNNIKGLIYISPVRNDVKVPYDIQQYTDFKEKLFSLQDTTIEVVNLENLVPNEYWGLKESTRFFGEKEYDFMHFQYKGHEMLGKKIFSEM